MKRKDSLSSKYPYTRASRDWGWHPDFEASFKRHMALIRRQARKGHLKVPLTGKLVFLSELADSRHPEVVIIPRDRYLSVSYEDGSVIGFEQIPFPFSSTDFYANLYDDLDIDGVFAELGRTNAFFRLGGIVQLGHLIPPIPEEFGQERDITYIFPQFPHTRWIHSLLVAILADIILARNGFSEKERAGFILTAACHDIATPAGGDSIKRMDPKNLDEEDNFSWTMEHYGLSSAWAEKFGFDLSIAQRWVKGEGIFGKLLDAIDKICYTALDCYCLGSIKPGNIRKLCQQNPLIIDVWQDLVFLPDKSSFAFSDPERLFLFLLLRAYEHKELLFDPYARTFDFFFEKLVRPLYEKGLITKEDLLTQNDDWLRNILEQYYPRQIDWFLVEPAELPWRKFKTKKAQQRFCAKMGDRIDHVDNIVGFNTGLDFPVYKDGRIKPLRKVISQEKVELLEGIAESTRGYYAYYKKE